MDKSRTEIDISRSVFLLIGIIIVFWLLQELSGILIPLVLALFMVMLLQPFLGFLLKKKVPNWIAVSIVSIFTLFLLFIFVTIMSSTVSQIAENGNELVSKVDLRIDSLVKWANRTFKLGISTYQINSYISKALAGDRITEVLGSLAKSLGSFTGSFFMFSLYFIILLSGFSKYREYILFVGGKQRGTALLETFESVMHSTSSYVVIKFLVSLLTGFIFWLICIGFGIKFALFWGFLAFALNFIPSIGSIIATIPPILMGLIYLDSGVSILIYSGLLIATQNLVGNILDPVLMGNRVKLNTLTVILGLLFWGYIWGIVGMLLSVPLLVFMRIILAQSPETLIIARAMSSARKPTPLIDSSKQTDEDTTKDDLKESSE